ncbi:MAG: TldD/PmbA family protein [Acidimicrobiales bacterium]
MLLELCDRVLELVGTRAEAEVTAVAGRSALTRFANSRIHQNVAEDAVHLRLRVAVGGRVAASSSTRVDSNGLQRLVAATLEAAALRPLDPEWPGVGPAGVGLALPAAERYDGATREAPPDQRAAVVEAFVAAAGGLEAAGYCSSSGADVAFANSAGRRVSARTSSATVDGIVRAPGPAAAGPDPRPSTADGSGWQTAGRLAELDGAAAGRTAAAKARGGAGPDPVELAPGHYPVVLEPACVADMVDFLVAHGFSAQAVAEGRSFVRLGEPQLDAAVSLWDDATDPRSVDLPFDAEGTPRRRVDLVAGGIPVGLLHDRRTAARAGVESTGHATPGGESYGPAPSTLFVGPGTATLDDLVAGVERGLLVTELWYTRILDPKTSVVTGLTRNGTFLIENGQVSNSVRNLRFTQSYARALAPGNVVGVGSDARLRDGAAVVPSLSLASWNVTGGASG